MDNLFFKDNLKIYKNITFYNKLFTYCSILFNKILYFMEYKQIKRKLKYILMKR